MSAGILRLVAALTLATALSASVAQADVGVGINLGRIEVTDVLKPGGGYELPGLGVINTGDQAAEYEVVVTYIADQDDQKPPAGWFNFQPKRFHLEPGESQRVDVSLGLPQGTAPGPYAALLEAHPVIETEGVSVGVAAAARLTFTVEPSSWFAAQRLRISRFLRDMEPWSYVVEGLLVAGLAVYLVARYSPIRPSLRFERRR